MSTPVEIVSVHAENLLEKDLMALLSDGE